MSLDGSDATWRSGAKGWTNHRRRHRGQGSGAFDPRHHRRARHDILLVSEGSIERAITLMAEIEKVVSEGAGAVSLVAVLGDPARFAGKRVGLVISGANIDSRMLASVLIRGLVRSGLLVRIRVEVSDQPGSLARVTEQVARLGGIYRRGRPRTLVLRRPGAHDGTRPADRSPQPGRRGTNYLWPHRTRISSHKIKRFGPGRHRLMSSI